MFKEVKDMNTTPVMIEDEERILGRLVKALPRMNDYQRGYLVCLLDMNSKPEPEIVNSAGKGVGQ